jgi:hypothetical protein
MTLGVDDAGVISVVGPVLWIAYDGLGCRNRAPSLLISSRHIAIKPGGC